jgi:hypothetical protein
MLSALAYGYIFPIYLNMINLPLGVSLLYLGATFAIFYVLLSAMSDFSKNSHANFFPSFAGAALQAFKLTASPGLVYSFYAYFSSVSAFFLSLTLALQVAAAAASILLVWGLLSHLETLVKSAVDSKKTSQSSAKAGVDFRPHHSSPLPISPISSNSISHPGLESVGQTNVNLRPFPGSSSISQSPSASTESPKNNAQQLSLDTSIGYSPSIHSSINLTPGDIQIEGGKAESKLDPNRSQEEINALIQWANTQVDSLSKGTLKSVEQENIKKLKSALVANSGITDNMDLKDFIEIFSQLFKFDSDLDQLDENGINDRILQFKEWCGTIEGKNPETYATFINRVNLDLIHSFVSCQHNELKTHRDEMAEIQLFKSYNPEKFWDNLRDLLVDERDLSHLQCAVSLQCVKFFAEKLIQEVTKSPGTFQASSDLNDKTKSFLLPCASKFLHLGMLNQSDLEKFPFEFQNSVRERCKVAAQAEQSLFGHEMLNALNREKAALLSCQFNSLEEVRSFVSEISGVELANNSSQIDQAAVGTYFRLLKKLNHYSDRMLDECKRFGISIMQLINIHFCNADPGLYKRVIENLNHYFEVVRSQILEGSASIKNLAVEYPVELLLEFINRGNEYAADALLGKLYGRIYGYDFLDFSSCNDSLEGAKVYLMAAKMGFISDQIGQLLNNSENLFSNKNPSDLQRFAQFLNVLLDDNQSGDDPICPQWNDSSQPVGALKERVQQLGACLKLKLGAGSLKPTKLPGTGCESPANRSTSVNISSLQVLALMSAGLVADNDDSSAHEDNSSPVTQNGSDRSDDVLWAVLKGDNMAKVDPNSFKIFINGGIKIPLKLMNYVMANSSFSEGEKRRVQDWFDKKLKAPQDTSLQSNNKENITPGLSV